MKKIIRVMTVALILASGSVLLAMGNKNSDRNAGVSSRASDSPYSPDVSTGKVTRSTSWTNDNGRAITVPGIPASEY
jgi:hypothetical protein